VKVSLAAVLVALAVLAAGCGKSKPATAADWTNGVCSAVSTWTTSLADAADTLKNGNVTKQSVQSAANDAKDATDKLTKDLKKLGKPNTKAGAQAQDTVDQLSTEIESGVSTIQDAVKNVSSVTGALTAVTTVSTTLTTLKNDITTAYHTLSKLDPGGELQQAFDQAPACASFRNAK
jgi:hypothetical protein